MSAILELERAVTSYQNTESEFDRLVRGCGAVQDATFDPSQQEIGELRGEVYLADPRRQRRERAIALAVVPGAAVVLTPFIAANAVAGGQPTYSGERVLTVGRSESVHNAAPRDTVGFPMHKLRTMRRDAESRIGAKTVNDDRITFLGKYARRLSLDELTQFENALFSSGSDNPGEQFGVVGLRPLLGRELFSDIARGAYGSERELREFYDQVYNRTPKGITGLGQVMGARVLNTPEDFRNYTDFAEAYHAVASVRIDNAILRATAAKMAHPVLKRFGVQATLVDDAM